jgi:hypothetical protein
VKSLFEFGLQYWIAGYSPSYSDPYLYQRRLNDYRRVDVGSQKCLLIGTCDLVELVGNFKELSLGLEIFNLLIITITNTWVRDVYSKMNMLSQII